MRKLRMVNSKEEIWDLMSKDFFAANPEGLGINIDTEYISEGASFKTVEKKVTIDQVKVDLMIMGLEPYELFGEFLEFLNSPPLYLEYTTEDLYYNTIWYRRDVSLSDLPKDELDIYGTLNVAMTLDKTSPWYAWIKNEIVNKKYIHESKVYKNPIFSEGEVGYMYPFGYSLLTNSDDDITGNINNESILLGIYDQTPMRVYITADSKTGPIENPGWEILNSEMKRLYYMKFNVTINPGQTLIVDSDWFKTTTYIYNEDLSKVNIMNKLSLASDSFIRLPKGKVTFKCDSEALQDIFMQKYGLNFLLEYKLEKVVV